MKMIPLGGAFKNQFVSVDDEDYEKVAAYPWYVWIQRVRGKKNIHIVTERLKGQGKRTSLPNFLLSPGSGQRSNYVGKNRFDCCRENIVLARVGVTN